MYCIILNLQKQMCITKAKISAQLPNLALISHKTAVNTNKYTLNIRISTYTNTIIRWFYHMQHIKTHDI